MVFDMDFVITKCLFSKVPAKKIHNMKLYKESFLRQNCVITFIWTINKIATGDEMRLFFPQSTNHYNKLKYL